MRRKQKNNPGENIAKTTPPGTEDAAYRCNLI